jgi:HEAT repeat protein
MSAEHVRRLTHALTRPETALAAAEALRDHLDEPGAVEGLVLLVHAPRTAKEATTALALLAGRDEPIVLDALAAALESPHSTVRLAAAQAVQRREPALLGGPLGRLLRRDESWLVRRAALDALADFPDWRPVLWAADDPHWRVRHALIRILLRRGEVGESRSEIDTLLRPHGQNTEYSVPSTQYGVPAPVAEVRAARREGVRTYLLHRWSPGDPPNHTAFHSVLGTQYSVLPFWDWDPAVLVRNLERLGEADRSAALDHMPLLLGHDDERVRAFAADSLRARGSTEQLARALTVLDEPRTPAVESVVGLFRSFDLDRTEEVVRFVLRLPAPTPAQLAWALDQVGVALPCEEEETALAGLCSRRSDLPAEVRRALAAAAGRWTHADADRVLRELLDDPDADVRRDALRGLRNKAIRLDADALRPLLSSGCPLLRAEAVAAAAEAGWDADALGDAADERDARVRFRLAEGLAARNDERDGALLARLRTDPHPHVRAAALTPARAAELVKEPERETSWHVLARAARLAKVPLWKLEPDPPWRPEECVPAVAAPLTPARPAPPNARLLGPARLAVSPVGVSGHYGLPVAGFVRAAEAGVNLMFWEPNYRTMIDFFARLSAAGRDGIHVIAGTFEADGVRVRRDAEKALQALKIERLALFLPFWVQSWARISDDVRAALERLKAEGKIAMYGLSTHNRTLAVEAMRAGWDPVMVRHSAGHRGAEERVFPTAAELGTSLITFNNTCYGRLLRPHDGWAPGAADCYRYALSQPAVRCCLSAPATDEQLAENLAALHDPALPDDRRQRLLDHGAALYAEETTFRRLVREL